MRFGMSFGDRLQGEEKGGRGQDKGWRKEDQGLGEGINNDINNLGSRPWYKSTYVATNSVPRQDSNYTIHVDGASNV